MNTCEINLGSIFSNITHLIRSTNSHFAATRNMTPANDPSPGNHGYHWSGTFYFRKPENAGMNVLPHIKINIFFVVKTDKYRYRYLKV